MRSNEFVTEKWSAKYKRSINCNNPKGFSQRAHCQGRKKKTNEESMIEVKKPKIVKGSDYQSIGTGYETGIANALYINQALKKAGYIFIGSGYDAQVWMKDEGTVVKILMPENDDNEALKTFKTFYNFVKSHSDLPNLPVFKEVDGREWFKFKIKGKTYMQFGMEQLYPLKNNSLDEWVVWMMADLSANKKDWSEAKEIMGKENDSHAKEFIALNNSQMKKYNLLYNTFRALHKLGKKRGYGWDPHTENVMQRSDGTLVITDPYA